MLGQKIGLLEALPIFRGLSKEQTARILDVAVKAYFEAGDNIIARDTRGDTAYLILSGTAQYYDFLGNPGAFEDLEPGCLVGEIAMFTETVHLLTVEAKTRVRALAFERGAVRRAMERDPAIARRISDNLVARLRSFASGVKNLDNLLAQAGLDESQAYWLQGRHGPASPFIAASRSS
jgi:CRP/FNR family transcriptional regulator, cyclic AMP receptor protein